MYCLPLEYIYGWIFTINPKNVTDTAKEGVKRYRRECYDALYRHFAGTMKRQIETNEAEIAALKAVNEALTAKRQADEAYNRLKSASTRCEPPDLKQLHVWMFDLHAALPAEESARRAFFCPKLYCNILSKKSMTYLLLFLPKIW